MDVFILKEKLFEKQKALRNIWIVQWICSILLVFTTLPSFHNPQILWSGLYTITIKLWQSLILQFMIILLLTGSSFLVFLYRDRKNKIENWVLWSCLWIAFMPFHSIHPWVENIIILMGIGLLAIPQYKGSFPWTKNEKRIITLSIILLSMIFIFYKISIIWEVFIILGLFLIKFWQMQWSIYGKKIESLCWSILKTFRDVDGFFYLTVMTIFLILDAKKLLIFIVFFLPLYFEAQVMKQLMNQYNFIIGKDELREWINLIHAENETVYNKEIAGFIHDEILQDIIYIRRTIADHGEVELEIMDQLIAQIRDEMDSISPLTIEKITFFENIEYINNQLKKRYPLKVVQMDIQMDPNLRIPKPYNSITYRMIKEFMTNIYKHTDQTKARIVLNIEENILRLTVSNEKGSIDLKHLKPQRFHGLYAIQEQMKALGGLMQIKNIGNEGTVIKVRIPMKGEVVFEHFID